MHVLLITMIRIIYFDYFHTVKNNVRDISSTFIVANVTSYNKSYC